MRDPVRHLLIRDFTRIGLGCSDRGERCGNYREAKNECVSHFYIRKLTRALPVETSFYKQLFKRSGGQPASESGSRTDDKHGGARR